jgi:hypothetical protein
LCARIYIVIGINIGAGTRIDIVVIIGHCASINIVVIIGQCTRVDIVVVNSARAAIDVVVGVYAGTGICIGIVAGTIDRGSTCAVTGTGSIAV